MTWFSVAELEYLLRIVLAALCGAAVGVERERRFKSAGIRTHVIVALSAALMMVVSKYGFYDVLRTPGISVDASRIASGVVTAIGFLGVGVIFFRKETVSGVTTAAGLWATVGVGIAMGAGMYVTGTVSALIIILFQIVLHRQTPLVKIQKTGSITLGLEGDSDPSQIYQFLEDMVDNIDSIDVRRVEQGLEVQCGVIFPSHYTAADVLRQLCACSSVREVQMYFPG